MLQLRDKCKYCQKTFSETQKVRIFVVTKWQKMKYLEGLDARLLFTSNFMFQPSYHKSKSLN